MTAAVAVELVHNFSLLHDDIMDNDTERRHRPTAWTVFGVGAAILAGDALGRSAVIQYQPPAPGDMPQTYADISKASQLLRYRPTTLIEKGIPQFVDWFRTL